MSELKLLNCPFCGGKATLKRKQKDYFVEWSVGCYNRGCVCSAHTYCYDNKDDAIRDWNTRTPMDNIVEKLEELPYGRSYHDYAEKGIVHKYLERNDVLDIVKQEINNGLE